MVTICSPCVYLLEHKPEKNQPGEELHVARKKLVLGPDLVLEKNWDKGLRNIQN